ncbi:hypothetical protein D9615_000989 [Tricholomella constricta]|uniref:DUF6533 domain-containing protein n=1 Tax=Tricholomella constricta TaxID=117010 RepID=A0A8H5HKZ3_9AGAR|nr:hypothetical protein D9615_000989 [Tricholomella constricta]
MAQPLSPAEIHELGRSLEGAEVARIMSIACFSLAVYEYMITLDEEMKYFWTGKWTISRVLFLTNRYLSIIIMMITIVCFSIPDPSPNHFNSSSAIQAEFLLNLVAISVIQGILVARIWYLFQGSRRVQIGVIVGFVVSLVLSLVFLYLSAHTIRVLKFADLVQNLPGLRNEGCKASRPPNFWRIYVPSLVLHTILYILTAVRALRNRRLLKNAPVLKRLLRDGGFFYFVVFVSVNLTAIGSLLKNHPKVNIPAIYSHFLLTTTSIAVSRVMLSIQSLAHKLGSDSAWLLNNVELSRVGGWRRGAHEGELIVERVTAYADDDTESDAHSSISKGSQIIWLKETRVGVYNERHLMDLFMTYFQPSTLLLLSLDFDRTLDY